VNATLDHGTEHQQCTCIQITHFQGLNQRQTVERLVEALRDADALLKISHSVLGTIRDNLEGNAEPEAIAKMLELTHKGYGNDSCLRRTHLLKAPHSHHFRGQFFDFLHFA
jgi:hypothetical protein